MCNSPGIPVVLFILVVVSLECDMPLMLTEHPSQFGPVTLQVLGGHTGLLTAETEQPRLNHILWLFLLPKLHLGRGITTPCPGKIFLLLNFCDLLGTNLSY